MYHTNLFSLIYLLIDNELFSFDYRITSRLIFENIQFMIHTICRYKFRNICQLHILYMNDTLILLQFRNDFRHREKIFF